MADSDNSVQFVKDAICAHLKQVIDDIVKDEILQAQKEIERRILSEVDRVALSFLSHYSVERMGSEICIRVKKEV